MEVISTVNLKGGSGKTTTTAYLAQAYANAGLRVFIVDADPQGSVLRWSETADWPTPTVALPVKNLHTRLPGIVPPDTDIVLIDTPPLDEQAGIVYSALRAADIVLVTMAPTMIEFERLTDVWAAIEEVESLRNHPALTAVLLNRVVTNANSTPTFRQLITESGHRVLNATIPRRENIAQAFAAPITDTGRYAEAADEIRALRSTR